MSSQRLRLSLCLCDPINSGLRRWCLQVGVGCHVWLVGGQLVRAQPFEVFLSRFLQPRSICFLSLASRRGQHFVTKCCCNLFLHRRQKSLLWNLADRQTNRQTGRQADRSYCFILRCFCCTISALLNENCRLKLSSLYTRLHAGQFTTGLHHFPL